MKSITSFFSQAALGEKIMLFVITPLISILISMKAILFGLWILILIDLLTGIRKSLHKTQVKFNPLKASFWTRIKSYLLRRTWRKTYEYAFGIITVIVLETMVLGETSIEITNKTFTISELSAIVPACIEVWSIFENFEAVSGNNPLKKIKTLLTKTSFKIK